MLSGGGRCRVAESCIRSLAPRATRALPPHQPARTRDWSSPVHPPWSGDAVDRGRAALLARIHGPLRQLERAAAEVRTLSGVVSGHVAVGMMPTIATVLGGDLAQQMAETYPDVALRIVEGYDGHLMEWVQRGNVDTTLLYGPAADLHLRVRPLFIEELRLVFRPGTLTETSLTLAEAAEHPLVLPSRPHGLRKVVDTAAHIAHIS